MWSQDVQSSCSLNRVGLLALVLKSNLVHVGNDWNGLTSLSEVRSRVVLCGIGQSFSILIDPTTEIMLGAEFRQFIEA